MNKLLLLVTFIFSLILVQGQAVLKGKVVDADTKQPLAFANVMLNDGPDGGITDIDGKFTIKTNEAPKVLKVNYVGYFQQIVDITSGKNNILVQLQMSTTMLDVVTVRPGINPADRIIEKVVENRNLNNHEFLDSYTYTSYEKMRFSPSVDTTGMDEFFRKDSGIATINRFNDQQYLFFMENITENSYKYPKKVANTVIASRISGFKNPRFVYLLSQMQSTSFYNDIIEIAGQKYVNPVSFGSTKKYYFHIEDTIVESHPYDTTFILSFRPFLRTNFEGLKGTLSISTNGYALRNISAEPSKKGKLVLPKIQQMYDWVDNSHWFPVQLNSEIQLDMGMYYSRAGVDSSASGNKAADSTAKKKEKAKLSLVVGKTDSTAMKGSHKIMMMGAGRIYIKDIVLNPGLKNRQFGFVNVSVKPDAYEQDEEIWHKYRQDSLTAKEKKTYEVMDSLGKELHLDAFAKAYDALIKGNIQIKFLDVDYRKFYHFNKYEGFYLGMGAHTNYRISERYNVGGYFGYGFRDKAWKYGGDFTWVFDHLHETDIKFSAERDVDEAGADLAFPSRLGLILDASYRHLVIDRMDAYVKQQVSFETRFLKWLKMDVAFRRLLKTPKYDYTYINARSNDALITSNTFQFSEASIAFRYAFKEDFVKTATSLMSRGVKAPIIWIGYTRGIPEFWGGAYEYNRFDFKIQKVFSTKYLGQSKVLVAAGFIDRDVPYVNLFNARAGYYNDGFTLYDPSCFITMRTNEFVSDRYATLYFSHDFQSLLYQSKKFKPRPFVFTNIGIGTLQHPENHMGVPIQDFSKGYFESGLLIDQLVRRRVAMAYFNVGLGAAYRYGPYSLPKNVDNFTFMASLTFSVD